MEKCWAGADESPNHASLVIVTRNSAPLLGDTPHQIGKNDLITDDHAEFHPPGLSGAVGLLQLKRKDGRAWAGLEIADAFDHLFQEEQQRGFERDVFAERHEMLLVVSAEQLPVRRQEIGAIEQKRLAVGVEPHGRTAEQERGRGAIRHVRRAVIDTPVRVHR